MRQGTLFAELEEPVALVSERGDVRYYPNFLDAATGDALVAELLATTEFVAESRMMYDRMVAVPRETAGRGDGRAQAWTPQLQAVREKMEALLGTTFDYVFINRYRDGRDSVAWHGDRDGPGKTVGSLSLGATRAFDLRPKKDSGLRPRLVSVDVSHGDLVVMAGDTQRYWEHRVRKDPRVHEQRLNLTFRQLEPR